MRIKASQAYTWITRAAIEHPHDLAHAFGEKFGVSRATSAKWLRQLVDEGWVIRQGTTRPQWHPGRRRLMIARYALPGLDESLCWLHDFEPFLDLPSAIVNIAHYGFTEMLNNANDHSGGTRVKVCAMQTATRLHLLIHDNGIGVFERIAKGLTLPDRRIALLELSKGKCTTDPSNHSGEGIFFCSRIFDRFTLEANDLVFTHDIAMKHDWLYEPDDTGLEQGTRIRMVIRLDSPRTLHQVFAEYGDDDALSFHRTVVPVKLARIGNENLISRSQAKRLIQRFDQFRTVVLDFEDVPEIGQAFADEVFRVFERSHPSLMLVVARANEGVSRMIARARAHQ